MGRIERGGRGEKRRQRERERESDRERERESEREKRRERRRGCGPPAWGVPVAGMEVRESGNM